MMYKIVCSYCDEEFLFENLSQKPQECHCNTPLSHLEPQKINDPSPDTNESDENLRKLAGVVLVYQKTGGGVIQINQAAAILGREGHGADLLAQIPQISRSHCMIECVDNQYLVSDLNSTNGTYIGVGNSRIDCKENPGQLLSEKDLLFLGREPFLVQMIYGDQNTEQNDISISNTSPPNEAGHPGTSKPLGFQCRNCGKYYEDKDDIWDKACEECGTFNEWEPVEKA